MGNAAGPDGLADTSTRSHCFQLGAKYEITTRAGMVRCTMIEVSDTQLRVKRLHGGSHRVIARADVLRIDEVA